MKKKLHIENISGGAKFFDKGSYGALKNLMPCADGLMKRNGHKTVTLLRDTNAAPLKINGIFAYSYEKDKEKIQCKIVHAGTHFFKLDKDFRNARELEYEKGVTVKNERSRAFYKDGLLYILGAGDILICDGDGAVLSLDCELYSSEQIESAKGAHRRKMIRANRKRKRTLERAVRVKIKQLTPSVLTCEGVKENNPFDFGKSKREYSSQKNITDAIGRIVMAIIFGYFGVSLVSEVNPAVLIWNTLQIVMYVSSGILQMYSSYFWVVDEHRAGVIKKIDYLQKFKSYALSLAR